MDLTARALALLEAWAIHAEQYWYAIPGAEGLGCYGTGYNAWGVQTNQKYLSAMAVLGTVGAETGHIAQSVCRHARDRALSALRFSLSSHVSGDGACTDGTQWGHTWISALGIERMMHGVHLLAPYMGEEDRNALRRVLVSESEWLIEGYHRGAHRGIVADKWNHSGKNAPESNLWNGALLWRTAAMYPDHAAAIKWREQAHRFLVNAVSVDADADDERPIAGKPVREWHVGAGFFPGYALDHHGYLNVGYMFICLSNAAMLHFDLRSLDLACPQSLYHHQRDLWQVCRRFLFADGRLARIGGDSRLRYTYCQEYALPALLFAADHLGEAHAAHLLHAQLGWIEQEAAHNNAGRACHRGSFYGERLHALTEQSPYYYTRLESDRACALGMALAYSRLVPEELLAQEEGGGEDFEVSVEGTWDEPEHGAVLHRCPTRLASFSWRAHGLAQGLCQPPDDGHRAEWSYNLVGGPRFLGDDGTIDGGQTRHRALLREWTMAFPGGFATCGAIAEGVDVSLAEGWQGARSAVHQVAVAALPDGHTMVGLQFCRTDAHRTYLAECKGLQLNVPNDLFNGFQRRLQHAQGAVIVHSPPSESETLDLGSLWANVDERLGAVCLFGDTSLKISRSHRRRGGKYASLYVDEICLCYQSDLTSVEPDTVILDVGWAVLSSASPEETRSFAQRCTVIATGREDVRAVRIVGLDSNAYAVVANWGGEPFVCAVSRLLGVRTAAEMLAPEGSLSRTGALALGANQVSVLSLGRDVDRREPAT